MVEMPLEAAVGIAREHGIFPDRREILQQGSTLVVRLTDSLVVRVVVDVEGPRQGLEWFGREIAVAGFLAERGAPVIPVHPDLPPGPYERDGYVLNFWKFVTRSGEEPVPAEVGRTLARCHSLLEEYAEPLPELGILEESLLLLDDPGRQPLFPEETAGLLRKALEGSLRNLGGGVFQALHGDAHPGNLMQTTEGLLWTDWEDTFRGPVEWDLASVLWNVKILEGDEAVVEEILGGYREGGGTFDPGLLDECYVARAGVMSAWYPVLYPDPTPERRAKLNRRLEFLAERVD